MPILNWNKMVSMILAIERVAENRKQFKIDAFTLSSIIACIYEEDKEVVLDMLIDRFSKVN